MFNKNKKDRLNILCCIVSHKVYFSRHQTTKLKSLYLCVSKIVSIKYLLKSIIL